MQVGLPERSNLHAVLGVIDGIFFQPMLIAHGIHIVQNTMSDAAGKAAGSPGEANTKTNCAP